MIIRAAREADAPAMGRVMVSSYLAAHRDQMPEEAWAKRAEERTPEESAQGWARTLCESASGQRSEDCIYVAVDDGGAIVGLAMGGPVNAEERPQTGVVYALYISTRHQGQGLVRRLVQAVAAELAHKGDRAPDRLPGCQYAGARLLCGDWRALSQRAAVRCGWCGSRPCIAM